MILLRTELGEGDHDVAFFLVLKFSCVTRWVDDSGLLEVSPQRLDMLVCPRAIGSNLISEASALSVYKLQGLVVDLLKERFFG